MIFAGIVGGHVLERLAKFQPLIPTSSRDTRLTMHLGYYDFPGSRETIVIFFTFRATVSVINPCTVMKFCTHHQFFVRFQKMHLL